MCRADITPAAEPFLARVLDEMVNALADQTGADRDQIRTWRLGQRTPQRRAMSSIDVEREPRDIHDWFGLTYSNYLVLPRSLMQSMPEEWQHRATALFDEMHQAFNHVDWPQYKVLAGKWCYLDDLSDADLERLGVTSGCEENPDCGRDSPDHECDYYYDGDQIDRNTACIFAPSPDPIPHYRRGRTHVPRADEMATG